MCKVLCTRLGFDVGFRIYTYLSLKNGILRIGGLYIYLLLLHQRRIRFDNSFHSILTKGTEYKEPNLCYVHGTGMAILQHILQFATRKKKDLVLLLLGLHGVFYVFAWLAIGGIASFHAWHIHCKNLANIFYCIQVSLREVKVWLAGWKSSICMHCVFSLVGE